MVDTSFQSASRAAPRCVFRDVVAAFSPGIFSAVGLIKAQPLSCSQPSRRDMSLTPTSIFFTIPLCLTALSRHVFAVSLSPSSHREVLDSPPLHHEGSPILAGFRAACLNAVFSPVVLKSGKLPGRDGLKAGQTESYPESSVRAENDTHRLDQVTESTLAVHSEVFAVN